MSTVSFTVKRHSETGGNSDRKRSGRLKATTESEHNFWESTAYVMGGSQDNSFKHSVIMVLVSKSQFQLWREDFVWRFDRSSCCKQIWPLTLRQFFHRLVHHCLCIFFFAYVGPIDASALNWDCFTTKFLVVHLSRSIYSSSATFRLLSTT